MEHSATTSKYNIFKEILSDIVITLDDAVMGILVNSVNLLVELVLPS
jgi:hypothetical protein